MTREAPGKPKVKSWHVLRLKMASIQTSHCVIVKLNTSVYKKIIHVFLSVRFTPAVAVYRHLSISLALRVFVDFVTVALLVTITLYFWFC